MRHWIVSAPFDLGFVLGPAMAATAAVLLIPALQSPQLPLWGWIVVTLSVDVAHTWTTLYVTYLDPEAYGRRKSLFLCVPLACLAAGALAYAVGTSFAVKVYTYAAVWHFVRQQYGFMRFYKRVRREREALDAWIDGAAVYAATLYPVFYWHCEPARSTAAWFATRGFFNLPETWLPAGRCLYASALILFVLRQGFLLVRGRDVNWGKAGVIVTTAAAWYTGMVALNSTFAFLIAIGITHGIPYYALVWLYGHRKWSGDPSWRRLLFAKSLAGVLLFLSIAWIISYVEMGVLSALTGSHTGAYFELTREFPISAGSSAVLLPVLFMFQTTHYVLDAYIWRLNAANPNLEGLIFRE
ncbi:MAG: hypothetical protein AAB036_10185 [Elusimicrobiota bacterium]